VSEKKQVWIEVTRTSKWQIGLELTEEEYKKLKEDEINHEDEFWLEAIDKYDDIDNPWSWKDEGQLYSDWDYKKKAGGLNG